MYWFPVDLFCVALKASPIGSPVFERHSQICPLISTLKSRVPNAGRCNVHARRAHLLQARLNFLDSSSTTQRDSRCKSVYKWMVGDGEASPRQGRKEGEERGDTMDDERGALGGSHLRLRLPPLNTPPRFLPPQHTHSQAANPIASESSRKAGPTQNVSSYLQCVVSVHLQGARPLPRITPLPTSPRRTCPLPLNSTDVSVFP